MRLPNGQPPTTNYALFVLLKENINVVCYNSIKVFIMRNINYTVKPESSLKVAPIKKKDINESLQEANESAEKLNERMTELAS